MHQFRTEPVRVQFIFVATKTQNQSYYLPVWESEEWLQEHVKPLAESGGKPTPVVLREIRTDIGCDIQAFRDGVPAKTPQIPLKIMTTPWRSEKGILFECTAIKKD